MQRARMIVMAVSLWIAAAITGWAQTGNPAAGNDSARQGTDLATLVRQLSEEVRMLKLEMLQLRFESQKAKLAQVEREVEQTRKDKQRLESQERKFTQDMAKYDERLGQPDLESNERTQLESIKARMLQGGQRNFAAQHQQIEQQETEAKERLAHERERWEELVTRAKKLGIKLDDGKSNESNRVNQR